MSRNDLIKSRKKKNTEKTNSLNDLWDNIKSFNINITGIPKEKERWMEWIFEEIMVENIQKLIKSCKLTNLRGSTNPKKKYIKKITLKDNIINFVEAINKEKIFKNSLRS